MKPPYKKEMAVWLVDNYRVSACRACRCVRLSRSMYYYRHHPREDTLLKMRITEIAHTRVRYGFARIFVLLRRSLKGADVVAELSKACLIEGCFPQRIQCDNGSEFISKEVDMWAYQNKVTLDFSRPGKPTDNPYVEANSGMSVYL